MTGDVSTREWELPGGPQGSGRLHARAWVDGSADPTWLAVLVHGYGEHIGRYDGVARLLCAEGAAVYGPDHRGHGRSSGERVLIEDFADVVEDVHRVVTQARSAYRSIPLVVIGHSMGGLIAARYAQRYRGDLAGLVLSGPVLGRWSAIEELAGLEEIPDAPIDPATLSRDPSVGAAYTADELVWHGPFKRPTVLAIVREMERAAADGTVDGLPLLWVHGSDDRLVPVSGTKVGIESLAGPDFTARIFPGARHEVFNEVNRDEVLEEVTRFARRCAGRG
ncbi:alpha-beta hydrolase superfamily lysophospholipase [Spinactinospora alkalitolerans]|uniref:Alpha-beta hydrolase superfamily lysophospholipase n=1 Tax=Spinactinospora alkalitolerans TaxID=687207 RepID=A0A852TYK7_9ACTN|nr:alpha/beta hydrolase [Spinactinospora alkalitolerans]NYE48377.1 alpha-beta hydrolase superfamily lysophospholipase [Spinactinospora alkalitolerans]